MFILRGGDILYLIISELLFFAMTSAFEGFPMSIIEAQQNGVVPIVMDSFLSVHDIIDNDVNGVLISYGNTTMFAESLKSL